MSTPTSPTAAPELASPTNSATVHAGSATPPTAQTPAAPPSAPSKRVRKPAPIPTSDLLRRVPSKLAQCTRGAVDAIMSEVADKNRKGTSHVRVVKQLVSVKTSVKKQLAVVDKYVQALLKDKQVPDVPACLSALTDHYRQQDCSVVSGKYLACGVKGLMATADVAALDVGEMPLDEAKRVMPAWALIRAASEQGFQPVAVCNDKMVDGQYVVQSDGTVPPESTMLHIARTKSAVSNGHTDALTVWNANAKCYPTKPVPRKLNNTQRRVLKALENLRQTLSLDVEYEPPTLAAPTSNTGGAAAAGAVGAAPSVDPAPAKAKGASKKRLRDDAASQQPLDDAAGHAAPKRPAVESD